MKFQYLLSNCFEMKSYACNVSCHDFQTAKEWEHSIIKISFKFGFALIRLWVMMMVLFLQRLKVMVGGR